MTLIKKVDLLMTLNKTLEEMMKNKVYVGIPGEKTKRRKKKKKQSNGRIEKKPPEVSTMNNATLAYIHDKGSEKAHIPPRPFLGPGVKKAAPGIARILAKPVTEITSPHVAKQLNKAGMLARDSVKNRIRKQIDMLPLKQSTIDHKPEGADKALILTGQMVGAVSYVIRK